VGEGVLAGALAEDLLVVLDGLGQLVRGAGPAQLAVGVDQHDPGGVDVEELPGGHHRACRVLARSCWGCRLVRVPMLLASMEGSIGMGVPLRPVAELANPVNRPGTMVALGADQAQQPHEVVGVPRVPTP
jgi:hypothetical protein